MTRAKALPPAGVSFTCSNGGGSLIDYLIASDTLAPYLRVSKYQASPFKTHCCLEVRLPHAALLQEMTKRVRPK
eukprot:407216-Pyramimonas_sp.AAC.1